MPGERRVTSACLLGLALALAACDASAPNIPPPMRRASQDAGARDATVDTGGPDVAWDSTLPDAPLSVADALPDVAILVDDANCVPPGTASNAIGVGGYCGPGGGQCDHAGADRSTSICTADFAAPAHTWFCTIPCATNDDCGSGSATCVPAASGMVCLPSGCGAFAVDAAADGAVDAGLADGGPPRDGGGG